MKNTACIAVAGICFALAAHGSVNVFDDAVFWFRGGKDCVTADGYMQQGEFFDDLHANAPSDANHNMPMSSSGYYAGGQFATLLEKFKKNAEFKTEPVIFPALGTNIVRELQVLHISDVVVSSGGNNYYFPFSVNPRSVFARYSISNEYTVVSRIRLDDLDKTYYFLKIGYDESLKQGLKLGLMKNPQYSGCKCLGGYCFLPESGGKKTAFQLRNLPVPTNTWVDVAVVVGNGNLRVGVAVPQSLASSNPTIGFAETTMWTENCQLLDGDESYCLFCPENISAQARSDKECFLGSVQQLAIWGRALSDQDVMAAFGMPRPAILRIGFDNGSSNEFGGKRTGLKQTIDGLGSWQGVWGTMLAGDEWTVNFDALRDEAGLPQIFSIKSLPDSIMAQIEPILTNASCNISLGERHVSSNGRTFWPVPKDRIIEGVNTLIVKRKTGDAGEFKMDAMELGGSFGVGSYSDTTDDGRVMPGLIAAGIPSAADPNPQHWSQGLYPDEKIASLRFRVWVDPDVADRVSSTFSTSTLLESNGNEFFTIYVNGESKSRLFPASEWQHPSLEFGPGELKGGWNEIGFACDPSYECHWLFGYYRFETVLGRGFSIPPPGMCIIMR